MLVAAQVKLVRAMETPPSTPPLSLPLSPAVFEWTGCAALAPEPLEQESVAAAVPFSAPDSGSETETEPLPGMSRQDCERLAYMSVFTAGLEFVMVVHGQALAFATCQCALNAAMTEHLLEGARPDLALRFTSKGSN